MTGTGDIGSPRLSSSYPSSLAEQKFLLPRTEGEIPHYFLSLSKASFTLSSPTSLNHPQFEQNIKKETSGLQTQTQNLKLTKGKPQGCRGFSQSSAAPSHHPKVLMISSPTSLRTVCTPDRACSEPPRACPFPFSSTNKHHFERAMGCVISMSCCSHPTVFQ